ncbi:MULTISPECIES: DUF5719 family protein [Kitasatospora]|uniref:Uncharacterized protein n=2 Tax=Kitasatospora TaxID=2063 RepID=A0ABT1IYU0_9ACTN|nr:DUF5719 family protein [Kitasatospora paracochleata]MCP2310036.1 hypothetical protein [Kitasatospora paracochleata]
MKKPNLKAPSLKAPNLKAPKLSGLKTPDLGAIAGGSRTGQSLLAGAAVLALVFGVAELRSPVTKAATGHGSGATTTQVERTSLVCQPPTQGLIGSTTYTMFTPGGASATDGTAVLNDVTPQSVAAAQAPAAQAAPQPSGSGAPASGAPAAPQAADARLTATKPGVPAAGPAANGEAAPGAFAVAAGAYAPGFTITQTTSSEQAGPALSGVDCMPSGTNFWFAGAGTGTSDRVDYVTLVNADPVPAVVDVRMYGDKGLIDNELATGIAVAPGSAQSIRLPGLTKGPVNDLAINVVARSGRVGAGVHALDGPRGADWLQPSADPAPSVTIPGVPADTASARLVVAAPGEDDADLKIQVSGKNGWITPAGHETIHVKAGMVEAVDLGPFTHGESSAVKLTPSDPAHPSPVVAGLRVDRTNKGKSDAAWLSGAAPIGARASIADNRAGQSVLLLTAVDGEAKVKVSASAGSGGGTPVVKEVPVPAGATVQVDGIEPAGLNGPYGITVETESGGPVTAARILTIPVKDVPAFTVQELRDDHSTVRIPATADDPGVVVG